MTGISLGLATLRLVNVITTAKLATDTITTDHVAGVGPVLAVIGCDRIRNHGNVLENRASESYSVVVVVVAVAVEEGGGGKALTTAGQIEELLPGAMAGTVTDLLMARGARHTIGMMLADTGIDNSVMIGGDWEREVGPGLRLHAKI